MNSNLQGNEYILPDEVKNHLIASVQKYPHNYKGIMRANELINSKSVNYGQLKRILHDLKHEVDKEYDTETYNLWGGEPMEKFGWSILNGDRSVDKGNRQMTKDANDQGNMGGMRRNGFIQSHEKKSTNKSASPSKPMKSNSDSSSASSLKLFEEIKRIKNLM